MIPTKNIKIKIENGNNNYQDIGKMEHRGIEPLVYTSLRSVQNQHPPDVVDPSDCEPDALPAELMPLHFIISIKTILT